MGRAECACGCGELTDVVDKKGRPKSFIHGHNANVQPRLPPGICDACGVSYPRSGKKRGCKGKCNSCYHKQLYRTKKDADPEAVNTQRRNNARRKRQRVLARFGAVCHCCGEANHEFLAIDHIHGGGRKDRLTRSCQAIYTEALHSPDAEKKYRVLCHNCNFALGHYGYCPHDPACLTLKAEYDRSARTETVDPSDRSRPGHSTPPS